MKPGLRMSCDASVPQALQRKVVAKFDDLDEAVAACHGANRIVPARRYRLEESGKAIYGTVWID